MKMCRCTGTDDLLTTQLARPDVLVAERTMLIDWLLPPGDACSFIVMQTTCGFWWSSLTPVSSGGTAISIISGHDCGGAIAASSCGREQFAGGCAGRPFLAIFAAQCWACKQRLGARLWRVGVGICTSYVSAIWLTVSPELIFSPASLVN